MPRLDANPPLKVFRLFFMRWLLSAAVVFSAYNPSGYSYFGWVAVAPRLTIVQVFVGILLLTALIGLVRMAYATVGYVGGATIVIMLGMGLVFIVGIGLATFDEITITTYAVEVWISLTLAIAIGWAFVQKRISGERSILRSPP
jgi:hypothetical protein